ncbi:MAG TPA: hypothetical protein VGM25_02205 [Caulobacteraceae bacterium]|jgi:tetratricopeptide (TPR) repeat protein
MSTGLYRRVGVATLALALAAPLTARSGDMGSGHASAMADYDAWIRQHPNDPSGYRARGRLNLVLGKAGAAASDLEKAVKLKPNDAYNVLWLHFARNKENAPDAMELQFNAGRTDHAAWPSPLLDSMTGRIDAAAALAQAAGGQGKAKTARLCEAELFLGQDDLARGRRGLALDRLQAAARDCGGDTREAELVRANLPGSVAPALAPTPISAPAPISRPAPRSPPPETEPTLKPAWVASASQIQPQAQIQAQIDPRNPAANPLLLRGSLR